ncbi:MAG: GNAT family N-acetyltransferase [Defluviitaleaceae bacterium]|nr:GNAT family N-acetyltransferase [Defluviitaleaceae bacterium]
MVNLKLITSKNCFEICELKADEAFVATNEESMIEAYAYYVENGVGPIAYGIYNDETPVGFIMAEYCLDENDNDGKPYYYLWRMMIDNNHQGKGYGKTALNLFIQEIRKFPQGDAEKFFTSVVPENEVATKLYESFGFVKTGEMVDDEEGMALVL